MPPAKSGFDPATHVDTDFRVGFPPSSGFGAANPAIFVLRAAGSASRIPASLIVKEQSYHGIIAHLQEKRLLAANAIFDASQIIGFTTN